jgi:transcriptional regulator with XRE-family HTH domain
LNDLEKLAAKRMRMLRLGRGWSAEELSREYESQKTGSLNRATIAKIESEIRPIKAGEVEGVARVFGLTSADLLDPGGPTVFLSYADHDDATGAAISAWLDDHGFRVLSGDKSELDRQRPGSSVWRAIDNAQAFVVLLSPSFLSSPKCREELDLAVRRKQQRAASGVPADFIYVLQVMDASDLDTSSLESYPSADLATVSGRKEEEALSQLGSWIISGSSASVANPDRASSTKGQQAFLDRRDELDRVLRGVSSPAGPHFWLVISPPGLGKSWFLTQLAAEAKSESPGWTTRMVDLRLEAADHRHDAMTVVTKLFGIDEQPSRGTAGDLLGIAQKVIRDGRPCLCLLDSAELLPVHETAALREHLSEVYRLVQDSGNPDAQLAFVVASRREGRWRGVTPYPRLHVLPLDEFGTAIVQDALERLALRMHRVYSPAELLFGGYRQRNGLRSTD